ncbi:MAG: hypothetical protein Q9187_004922 [Circinaria calcarea]
MLQLRKKTQNRRIGLSKLREGPVSVLQMDLFDPPPLQKFSLSRVFPTPTPTWKPKCDTTERRLAFVGRVLEDFSHQWRHVLRSGYNDSTFRRLARAILSIATLDFRVKEVAFSRAGVHGSLVWLNDLPEWEPFVDRVIHFDRVSVVLCQHLTLSMAAIRKDLGPRRLRLRQRDSSRSPSETACDRVTYVVLSVREVFLYKTSVSGELPSLYTEPEPLLNGTNLPSKRALEYLLMAAPLESVVSPIHKLPLEVQNMILENVSLGPLESARIGCLLAFGSAFQWKSNGREITRQEVLVNKHSAFPVESEIWFGDRLSGLVYR